MGGQNYFTPGARECFGAQLYVPLIVGQKYYASMKVNAAHGGGIAADGFCNKMGIKLSTVSFSQTNAVPINNAAQIYSDSIIKDTLNWVTVRGSFIADSAYDFIIIGNFFDDAHTDTIHQSTGWIRAYYFYDDICVTTDTNTCSIPFGLVNLSQQSHFIFTYPNPASYFVNAVNKTNNPMSVEIYDEIGNMVLRRQNLYSTNTVIGLEDLKSGLYFIRAVASKEIYTDKLIISH